MEELAKIFGLKNKLGSFILHVNTTYFNECVGISASHPYQVGLLKTPSSYKLLVK